MHITEAMIERANAEFTLSKSTTFSTDLHCALLAVYPMIRDAVLEEAASMILQSGWILDHRAAVEGVASSVRAMKLGVK